MEYLNSQAVGAAYGLDATRDTAIGSNTTAIAHDSMPTPMMTQTPTNATARAISAKWVEKHSTKGSVYHHRGSVCEHSGSSDDSDYDDNYSEEDDRSSNSDSSSDSGDSESAYSESDNGQARHASVKLTQSKHRATAVDSPVRRQQRQQQQNDVSAVSDIETGVTTPTATNSSAGHTTAHARVRHSSDGSDDNV
jgi:hypothetical protein